MDEFEDDDWTLFWKGLVLALIIGAGLWFGAFKLWSWAWTIFANTP